ncbi:MAG: hypothetical protein WC390_10270 [Sulfurimonas sp.]|jgi:hypothetical protein
MILPAQKAQYKERQAKLRKKQQELKIEKENQEIEELRRLAAKYPNEIC